MSRARVQDASATAMDNSIWNMFKNPVAYAKQNLGFEFWQRFSKALIIVIAVMPAAGIFISVGRLFGEGFLNGVGVETVPHWVLTIGTIIEQTGWVIIGQLGPLFAVSIAGAWGKDKAGAAFSGFIMYLVFHTVLHPMATGMWGSNSSILDAGILDDATLGISTIKGSQVFSGILLGFIAGNVYNKFEGFDKLPNMLSFFNGKRFVPMAAGFFAIVWAVPFALIFPWVSVGFYKMGEWFTTGNNFFYAPFLYGMFERLLLPFGLHHMITVPMNYTALGGVYQSISQPLMADGSFNVIGGQDPLWLAWMGDVAFIENTLDMGNVWDQEAMHAEGALFAEMMANGFGSTEQYMSVQAILGVDTDAFFIEATTSMANTTPARFKTGQVYASTFMLPAGAIAMWLVTPKENRSSNSSVYLAAAASVAIAGITEPIEFMFAFISPAMYVGYAMLTGLVWGMADVFNSLGATARVHAFGLIEVISRAPQMLSTSLAKDWGIFWGFGIMWGAISFAYFYFATKYLKPAIPGMDANEDEDTSNDKTAQLSGSETARSEKIVESLGGKNNIKSVDNCMTRLRVTVADPKLFNAKLAMTTGATGNVVIGKGVQIIYGGVVEKVRNEVDAYLASEASNKPTVEIKPVVKIETVKPVVKTENVKPVVKTEDVKPVVKTENVKPVVKTEIVKSKAGNTKEKKVLPNRAALNKLTVTQLRNEAKKLGAKGYSSARKTQLVDIVFQAYRK